jgi:hypothetical protein
MEIITTITTITQTDKKTGQQTTTTQTTQTTQTVTVSSDDVYAAEVGLTLEEYYAWVAAYHGIFTSISDIEVVGPGADANDTSPHIYTLSDLYTPEDFVGNVAGWVPMFQNTYTPDVNSAYLHLPDDELTCNLYTLQYKWNAGNQGVGTVVWDEQFTPDSGGEVQHHVMSWTGSGESQVFTIDPANYPTVDNGQTVYEQNGTYHVIVLPVEVTDVSYLQIIRSTAWIKGHSSGNEVKPEMPKLEVRILGAPAAWQVEWKLENRYPRRGGRDDLNLPNVGEEAGVFVAGDQPWKIWEEVENTSGPKFFGGDVRLKYKIHSGTPDATTGEVSFKIRGENPNDARCKARIIANQGAVWYAWAIAKHESQDSAGIYNQFANGLANGGAGAHGAEGEPFYSPKEGDGWGLFQRDSASGHPVTTEETWNWDSNMKGFLHDEYPEHLAIANNYVNGVRNSHPTTFEEPQFTIKGRVISGRDVLALTWYNGPQGRSNASMLNLTAVNLQGRDGR